MAMLSKRIAQGVGLKGVGKDLESADTAERQEAGKKKGALRENIEAILVAILLALFIRSFIVQAFKIPSGSMKETLQIGDHILVNKFIYGIRLPFTGHTLVPIKDPMREDIIVFEFPEDPDKDFIKRVVAVAGDEVQIRNKTLFVNGKEQAGAYAVYGDDRVLPGNIQPRDNFGPIQVPEHKVFVMGDNRDFSYDSRFWGFVDLRAVRGKAFMIYWSWDNDAFRFLDLASWGKAVRWGRIGDLLR